MKRDYSKIAVLTGLVVLFVLSFKFGFLGQHHHVHFGWLRGMFPVLMIALLLLLFTRRGCCGRRRRRYGRRGRPDMADEPDEDL
jgi:hypothetical protein